MYIYLIPLSLLSLLAFFEINYKFKKILRSNKFYLLLFVLFIIFIGFRDNIGCDWDSYQRNFRNISFKTFSEIFSQQSNFFNIGYILITKIVSLLSSSFSFISLKLNFHINIFLISIIFTGTLFYFCSKLKRTYLALLMSYPYYLIVIGMGPIRQSLAISFLMMTILFVYLNNYGRYVFSAILSSSFHHSAIFVNTFYFTILNIFNRHKPQKYLVIIFYLTLMSIFFLSNDLIINKLIIYITEYSTRLNPAKGVIFVWIINFLPSIIYLTNFSKFKFNRDIKRLLLYYSIFEICLLPFAFINSIITYRLLLYSFPSSILITSFIPDINLFKIDAKNSYKYLIIICYASLIIWMKYAYHSYCWLPYENILFR
tara:strand:+ start:379 stop:1491 length:1113 start_codon:yes stop_codon:yes gene_type:complete